MKSRRFSSWLMNGTGCPAGGSYGNTQTKPYGDPPQAMRAGIRGLLMPSRRSLLKKTASGAIGLAALKAFGAEARADDVQLPEISPPDTARPAPRPIVREGVKITRLETFLVK